MNNTKYRDIIIISGYTTEIKNHPVVEISHTLIISDDADFSSNISFLPSICLVASLILSPFLNALMHPSFNANIYIIFPICITVFMIPLLAEVLILHFFKCINLHQYFITCLIIYNYERWCKCVYVCERGRGRRGWLVQAKDFMSRGEEWEITWGHLHMAAVST